MSPRHILVVPSNGLRHSFTNRNVPDKWSKLRGDGEFKNMTSSKLRELASVAVSEMMGTAIVVGLGCGSTVTGIQGSEGHISHLITVLTFAFAICLALTLFSHTSGCHINPAISLSAVIFGHLSLPRFLLYTVAQCVGGCLGIITLKVVSPYECTEGSFCVTLPNYQVGPFRATLMEGLLTGIVVLICNAAWDRRCQDKHESLPVKFGLAVAALALPGAKYSGASMNPARSFGPAVLSSDWTNHWVYWVGPMGGSIIASAIYLTFLSEINPPIAVPTKTQDPEEEHPL